MTLKVCFSDRLRFSLCMITAYCLMFNENQITVEENQIPKRSHAHAAMTTLQHYGLGMGNIIFQ